MQIIKAAPLCLFLKYRQTADPAIAFYGPAYGKDKYPISPIHPVFHIKSVSSFYPFIRFLYHSIILTAYPFSVPEFYISTDPDMPCIQSPVKFIFSFSSHADAMFPSGNNIYPLLSRSMLPCTSVG